MPEDTTPGVPPAGTPGSTPAPAATTTPSEPQAGDEPISLEEARKLRREAQTLRQKLKGFEDEKAAADAAKLTETERLQKQHTELQSKYESDTEALVERLVRYEVERIALKVGVRPEAVEDAAKLIDWSELEFDDDGMPQNAEKLLEKLLKNKRYLAAEQPVQNTQQQPAKPGTPAIPAMNPGRTSIQQPGQTTPGKIPRVTDIEWTR
jgi:hypothetical protein